MLKSNELKIAAETLLTKCLDDICSTVGITMSDWRLDDELFQALKSSRLTPKSEVLLQHYDNLYDFIKFTNIPIKPIFLWFYKLKQHMKNK